MEKILTEGLPYQWVPEDFGHRPPAGPRPSPAGPYFPHSRIPSIVFVEMGW
jgi:hypothetical protein